MRRMTTRIRDGLVLLAIAALCLLVSLLADGQAADVIRGLAILCGIGGLVALVVGLVRPGA